MNPVCDFCSAAPVVAMYEITPGGTAEVMLLAPTGSVLHNVYTDDGHWAACQECSDNLLQARDAGLIDRNPASLQFILTISMRSVMALAKKTNCSLPPSLVCDSVADMHEIFFRRWDGSDPKAVDAGGNPVDA